MEDLKPTICTVGAGAGFAGDRIDPAVTLAESGKVDAICLECLAERTLVPSIRARNVDPKTGYDPRLRRRLQPLLPVAVRNGVRIVSNLGAANPVAAGEAIAALAKELGINGMKVGAVRGDDVSHLADRIDWVKKPEGKLIGAHAYLGSEAMASALAQGAQVVVTGRVADSALFAAVARDKLVPGELSLAGAIAVGHLLECGGQLTGGNYEPVAGSGKAPPLTAEEYATLGYPLAEVRSDGSADIFLLDGAPGIVDPYTCTLQLLYEVHDPSRYATPDLVIDFTGIRFDQVGHNRVRMTGARSLGPPPTLKVAGFIERAGCIMDAEIAFAGRGAYRRAEVAAQTVRLRLAAWSDEDLSIDLVGVRSVLRAGSQLMTSEPPELRVHVSARCTDAQAQIIEDEIYAMTLAGPAGGCSVRIERRPRIEVLDGFIAHGLVNPDIVWSQS